MTKEDISRIIKESRMMAGLTQAQVAERLGRPQATVAGWEVGRSQPDANTLFELFRVLGRSVDEAFGFTVESFSVTARERAHLEKYRTLDPYGKNAVDGLLETEYARCFVEQNLADYKNRLSQMTEAIKRIQQGAQASDERTLDDITKEIRAIQRLFDEAVDMEYDLSKALGTLESPTATHIGGLQAEPPTDVPQQPQEDE